MIPPTGQDLRLDGGRQGGEILAGLLQHGVRLVRLLQAQQDVDRLLDLTRFTVGARRLLHHQSRFEMGRRAARLAPSL